MKELRHIQMSTPEEIDSLLIELSYDDWLKRGEIIFED
jgi:hypothetical protein